MFFDIGVQICGFEGQSKQDNGLNSTCNKMYALIIQKVIHGTQHRQISQIYIELYPKLAWEDWGFESWKTMVIQEKFNLLGVEKEEGGLL